MRRCWFPAALLLAATAPLSALAHHPMGGTTPQTWWTGLLSGIGHPVIGPDHLAFVLALGIAAALTQRGWVAVPAFALATVGGCTLHLAGLGVPFNELAVAGTVTALGAVLLGGGTGRTRLALLGGLAGLFHGHAYAEAIVGAEPTPLAAYLLGFAAVQTGLALAVGLGVRAVAGARLGAVARASGGAAAVLGAVLLVPAGV